MKKFLNWLPKDINIDIPKALEFLKKKVSALNYIHTLGVMQEAVFLSQTQQNQYNNKIDLNVVVSAAIFHDSAKDLVSFEKHADESAKIFIYYQPLLSNRFSSEQIKNIEHCIRSHSSPLIGAGEMPQTIEAKIIFDADMLQQMGPFGIAKHLEKYKHKDFEKRLLSVLNDLKVAYNSLITDIGIQIGKEKMRYVEGFVYKALNGK